MAGIPGRAPGSPGSTHIKPLEPLDPLGETRTISPEELIEAAKKKGGGTKISQVLEPIILEWWRDGYSTTAISNRLADEHQLNIHPATIRTHLRKWREARAQAVEEAIAQTIAKDATSDLTRLAKVITQIEEAMDHHASRPRMWLRLVETYRHVIDTKLKFTLKGTPIPAAETDKAETDFKSILETKLAALAPATPPVAASVTTPIDDDEDEDPGDPEE
jgi:hypothetical protein